MKIGVYLQSSVQIVGNKPFTYSEATQSNSTKSAVNIFLVFKKDNQRYIQTIQQPEFWIQNPLLVALCHQGFDTSKLKNPPIDQQNQEQQPDQGQLFEAVMKTGCNLVKNSQIFFNIAQMSPVQYQKNTKGQRYSYGGLRYFMSLVGSEIIQDNQKSFARNQGANKSGKLIITDSIAEGFVKDNLISGVYLNTIGDYKMIKQLVEGQRDNEICWFDFGDIQIEDIGSVSIHKLHSRNVLVIKHQSINKTKDLQQVNISDLQHQNSPLLIKFLQNIGMAGHQDMFDIDQNVGALNYQIIFQPQATNYFSAQIVNEEDLGDVSPITYKKDSFMEIAKVDKKDVQIQVMACNGLIKLKNKQKMMDLIQNMGCENIAIIDNFFPKTGSDFKKFLKDKPEDKQNLLKINGFQLEKMKLKPELKSKFLQNIIRITENENIVIEEQSIKIEGFKQNCDTIFDNFLMVLYIVCYLKYSFTGELFSGVSEFDLQESQDFATGVILQNNMLQALDIVKLKMQSRLGTTEFLSQDDCYKCVQAFFPCRTSVIAKFSNTSFKAICSNKSPICSMFQKDGPVEYTKHTADENKLEINNNFKEFDSLIKNLIGNNVPQSQEQIKQKIDQSGLVNQLELAQDYVMEQVESFAVKTRIHNPAHSDLRVMKMQKAEMHYQQIIGQLQELDNSSKRIII